GRPPSGRPSPRSRCPASGSPECPTAPTRRRRSARRRGPRTAGAPRPARRPRRRSARRSLALEARLALAEERRDALLRVLGAERLAEAVRLRLQALAELAHGRHALDLLDRDRRLLGHRPRPGQSGIEELVIRNDLVRQPEPLRLVRRDRIAGQVHLQRLAL